MLPPKWISGFRRLVERHDPSLQAAVHSVREMQGILQRERARADRTGHAFSLLTFQWSSRELRHQGSKTLVLILRSRVRVTDEIGWLKRGRLSVVLPHTSGAGARKLAGDLLAKFPARHVVPSCRVFVYPSGPTNVAGPGEAAISNRPAAAARWGDEMELLFIRKTPVWKRTLDLTVAVLGMAICLPIFVAIAIAIKIGSPGPVLFKQLRRGRGGRSFYLYKFRSMVVGAEAQQQALWARSEQDGPAFKLQDDPRITRLGKFLRSSSLDELPQLWNVFKGEMSLVGPRPLPVHEADGCAGWLRRRLDITPGITCIWQVRGRSRVAFEDWMRMDMQYLDSQSPRSDLKLLLLTIPAVVLGKGAK